jgi:hypothetical protein
MKSTSLIAAVTYFTVPEGDGWAPGGFSDIAAQSGVAFEYSLPSRLADSAFWSQRRLSRVFQQPARLKPGGSVPNF